MPEEQTPQTEEQNQEVYDERVYNLWISFNNCTIQHLHIEQYGKPVSTPPPPPGGE